MNNRLPDVSLIHIGLPKTATTYLQSRWAADPGVCLLKDGLGELIDRARREGRQRQLPVAAPTAPGIAWDQGPPQPGQRLVISNEALSNAFLNERADSEQIACFQQQAAALMRALVPKAKVLIVSRAPEAWVRSIYNQAIKQGGTDRYAQFLRREAEYLARSLDLRELYLCWRRHFGNGNVLILPVELLRDDETRFLREIERFCGLPPSPPLARDKAINPSLRGGPLEIMRQFNKWTRLLIDQGDHRGHLPPELARAVEQIRFATRYALESPTPQLERRLRAIARRMPVPDDTAIRVPKSLLKPVRARLGKHLKKDDFFGYRDLYLRGTA